MYWFDEELERMKKKFKWDFRELDDLDKLEKKSKNLVPLMNISDRGKEIVVKMQLPDVISRRDVKLKISSDGLEVRAKRRNSIEVRKKKSYQKNEASQSYYRLLTLPVKVNHKKAVIGFSKGILVVRLPKK